MQCIPCDIVVVAVGQGIESRHFEDSGVPVKRGVIEALAESTVKDIPGIFAGGDCVTGPATVIRAIAAGKVAAANIDEMCIRDRPQALPQKKGKKRSGIEKRQKPNILTRRNGYYTIYGA